jgi:hypothetical protein
MICKSTFLPYFKEFCNPFIMSCNLGVAKLHRIVLKIEFYKPCFATLQNKRQPLQKSNETKKKEKDTASKNNKRQSQEKRERQPQQKQNGQKREGNSLKEKKKGVHNKREKDSLKKK